MRTASVAFGSVKPIAPVSTPPAPFVRLRTVLLLGLIVGSVLWLWPRGRAAWQLHSRATIYADYSLCLVGPLGPRLFRESSPEFAVLLRRRVVSAPAEVAPFAACEKFGQKLGLEPSRLELHRLAAGDFADYWDESDGPRSAELALDTSALDGLSASAWPFVRGGHLRLVESSSHAHEAAHPLPPAAPGTGSGLPAKKRLYRSTVALGNRVALAAGSQESTELVSEDRGVHFERRSSRLASDYEERCGIDADGRSYTLTSTDSERFVLSHGPGAPPEAALLGDTGQRVVAISCDETALVAILTKQGENTDDLVFRLCPYRRACQEMSIPSLGRRRPVYPIDVARVGGDTIVAVAQGGLTRVTSSRDGGRSWAPWTVQFDRRALAEDLGMKTPFRLLPVADDVLLYGGGRRENDAYHLLVSRDHGATFRAPED